jgi:hypothetical protein
MMKSFKLMKRNRLGFYCASGNERDDFLISLSVQNIFKQVRCMRLLQNLKRQKQHERSSWAAANSYLSSLKWYCMLFLILSRYTSCFFFLFAKGACRANEMVQKTFKWRTSLWFVSLTKAADLLTTPSVLLCSVE